MAQDDSTLGGYFRVHDRPPAYEGSDGHPYTVSVETEKTADLTAPYVGYLVFPRWAQTGVGIVGHVETRTVAKGNSKQEVEERLGELTLYDVQDLLEEAIERATGSDDAGRASDEASDDTGSASVEASDDARGTSGDTGVDGGAGDRDG